ncbi:MAG: GHMP kinase [Thermomicrobiales bacterium]|nr:GHMP kinase [Thermomicrobiales bacterium]
MSVIARAPVRLSFGGGGTDLPAYADLHGGFVVSGAVARYAVAIANPSSDGSISVNSADYRTWRRWPAGTIPDIDDALPLPSTILGWFAERSLLPAGVDLFTACEIPPGSGLGSSSAMAVAIIHALAGWAELEFSPAEAAELACEIEIERLGRPIGRQDQYASAFGGLNAIAFGRSGAMVEPLAGGPDLDRALAKRLLLLSTGQTRDSASILTEQRFRTASGDLTSRLHQLKTLAREMRGALEAGDFDGFGEMLGVGWRIKRDLTAAISTSAIDRLYERARAAGALGGKICGAGGGGFLLLYAPPERHDEVITTLMAHGVRPLAFAFDLDGARVARVPFGAAVAPAIGA